MSFGVINTIFNGKFIDKLERFGISGYLLGRHISGESIKVEEMIRRADNKEEFDRLARREILKPRNTDFYHLSLVMGQYFGIYNLYCYRYLSPDVRKKLLESHPSLDKTRDFFNKYNMDVFQYCKDTYDLDYDQYLKIVEQMFRIDNDYRIYNNDVAHDISKILMGNDLYKIENSNDTFVGCCEAIAYFDEINEKRKENLK